MQQQNLAVFQYATTWTGLNAQSTEYRALLSPLSSSVGEKQEVHLIITLPFTYKSQTLPLLITHQTFSFRLLSRDIRTYS